MNRFTFKTLYKAIETAGLVDAMSTGSYTVFAPTDAAFEELGAGELDAILADLPRLVELVKYHVVEGESLIFLFVRFLSAFALRSLSFPLLSLCFYFVRFAFDLSLFYLLCIRVSCSAIAFLLDVRFASNSLSVDSLVLAEK
jgi:pilus assembly protein TadC